MTFNFTCVQGSVTIPTMTIPSGESSGANFLALWVGIGGSGGNDSLWQAGIWLEQFVSSKVMSWWPWHEEYWPGGPTVHFLASANQTLPTSMFAQVCTQKSGLDLYDLIFYSGSGGRSTYIGSLNSAFFPNATTAEWIAESPYSGGWTGIPDFTGLTWSNPSYSDQLESMDDFFDSFGSFAVSDGNCGCGQQYANPTNLTSNDTSFGVDYGV
jgi:hypothetical protein